MRDIADIAGDNAVHLLSFGNVAVRWIQFAVTGSGTARIGSSSVGTGRGIPVAAGGGFFLPPLGALQLYGNQIYAYVPTGATLSVGYEI